MSNAQAVATRVETTEPAPVVPSNVDSFLAMIERAARDPAVDIDKMERLYGMRERHMQHVARVAYDSAFPSMQEELPEIDKRGRIIIRDKNDKELIIQSTPYALWEDTNRLIKPILSKHGFALSFRTGRTPEGLIETVCILSHREGHREETTMLLPHDSSGSKNAVQAVGSSTAYGKRYTATAILNITTRGEDDDGKKGGDPATLSDAQIIELRDIILAVDADEKKFLQYIGKVERIADIKASDFERAKAALDNKAKKAGK